MNLHENKDAFTAAIQLASASKEDGGLGIKQIYLEKDYWICRSPKRLSECKESEVAVFKGGPRYQRHTIWGIVFQEIYLKELPELSYQDIPSAEDVAVSFREPARLLL